MADDDEDDRPMHVLDLPQLHTHPPASSLLSLLSHLALSLSSWDITNTIDSSSDRPRSIDPEGVASYLTRIISSPLNWIEDEADKEAIWETASKRLSERSGRSAMPSLSRTFKIPMLPTDATIGTEHEGRELEINIYEPSLTGDNLGHKTWIASYLLAKRLAVLLPRHFPSITLQRHNPGATKPNRPKILELGAGTGLVGLAASGLFPAAIHLTDLPFILPNLQYNIQQNISLVENTGSTITAGVLDWSNITTAGQDNEEGEKYDIILAADSLYAPEHAGWVVRTVGECLRKGKESRVFVELPLRDGSVYPEDFRRGMEGAGFEVLEEGEESGYDDWEDEARKGIQVTCLYSVWAWARS